MGYESRLYIVEKANALKDENEMYFGEIVAIVNLCKIRFGSFEKAISMADFTDTYIYAVAGNTKIIEDCCGERLKETSLKTMFKALSEGDQSYRRIPAALSLIKSFLDNSKQWNNLCVLHYGY